MYAGGRGVGISKPRGKKREKKISPLIGAKAEGEKVHWRDCNIRKGRRKRRKEERSKEGEKEKGGKKGWKCYG